VLPIVYQQAFKSTTRQGITQGKPNRLRKHFKWHKQPRNEEEIDLLTPHSFLNKPINHNGVLLPEIVQCKNLS
jgi:hypothetical protein